MKLYNTLTKKVEKFTPLDNKRVKIYNCGPTVYDYPTLGNLRTYINIDLLRRSLNFLGYKVNEVMNITDIEDKIINRSKVLGIRYQDFTKKYEKAFLDDLKALNIEMTEKTPHATEEIPEIIKIISDLLKNGYAYKSEDGSVYFDINKFKDYGRLSNLDKRELKTTARIESDEYDKENVRDFALWKAEKEGEPSWKAPFGRGRPGWHIECTAMSLKYLGEQIDIHAGAVDLIFPHHENEIAQSEAYTGKPFVKYWFHPEHLLINGRRMGKSEGNAYTLSDLREKFNVEPLAFRLLCLQSHYQDKLNFTEESIKAAQKTLDNIKLEVLKLIFLGAKKVNIEGGDFRKELENDLSIPKALAVVFEKFKSEQSTDKLYSYILKADEVLGLGLADVKLPKIPEKVGKLVAERENLRKDKKFGESDKVRDEIKNLGYVIEDTPKGPFVYPNH